MSHEVASKIKQKSKNKGLWVFFSLRRKKLLGNFKEGIISFVSYLFAPLDITLEE